MRHPNAMPIGFTYDGEPLYPAAPAPAGEAQPLAVMTTGEAVWPAPSGLVAPGQPQPFGVLASGAFVWAVEQPQVVTQRPRRRLLATVLAAVAVAAGGAGAVWLASDENPGPQQESGTREAVEPPPAPVPADKPPAQETSAVDFTMPDLSGVDLQQAQDQVQELGVLFSRSHDLRGTRSQVVDSGWRVCDQVPAAGTRVRGSAADWEGRIDFGVVRLSEQCP